MVTARGILLFLIALVCHRSVLDDDRKSQRAAQEMYPTKCDPREQDDVTQAAHPLRGRRVQPIRSGWRWWPRVPLCTDFALISHSRVFQRRSKYYVWNSSDQRCWRCFLPLWALLVRQVEVIWDFKTQSNSQRLVGHQAFCQHPHYFCDKLVWLIYNTLTDTYRGAVNQGYRGGGAQIVLRYGNYSKTEYKSIYIHTIIIQLFFLII